LGLGSDAANLMVISSGPYTGSFSQANVGNSLVVTPATTTSTVNGINYTTMAGVSLSGSAAANYYVTGPSSNLTAAITPAPLTITAFNQASFVTQNRAALTYVSSGLLGSDTIVGATLTTLASSTQPAGNYAITVSNATGASMSNYQITYAPGTYTIVAAGRLLINSSGATTPYSTAASFANPTVSYATSGGAVINNLYLTASTTVDGVTTYTYSDGAGASLSFNFAPTNPVVSGSSNVNAGVYGLSAANFQIAGSNITTISPVVTGNLTVTPRALNITATPATYIYNGAVRVLANSASTPGIITGDLVSITDSVAAKNVGNYFSSLLAIGADAGNYKISYVNANLSITPYLIGSTPGGPTMVATAANRVYNTTDAATGMVAMTNLFAGDSVTVNFTSAAFNNANVANSKMVAFSGVTLSGASSANYAMATGAITATANITQAPVTISGLVAASKQYDGNTAAVISGAPTIRGLLGADASTLTGGVLSGTFASSNVATGLGVTANLSSLTLGNGNYYIAGVTIPLVADITSPPQTINNMAVVQQVSPPSAPTFAPQVQRVIDNKGDTLYVRDAENMNGFFEAIPIPPSGTFRFPLPNQLLQNLIDMTGVNNGANSQGYKYLLLTDGATLSVSAEDGTDLPKGVTYSAATRAFTVANLAEVTLPISVNLTITRQGNVVSTKKLLVTR